MCVFVYYKARQDVEKISSSCSSIPSLFLASIVHIFSPSSSASWSSTESPSSFLDNFSTTATPTQSPQTLTQVLIWALENFNFRNYGSRTRMGKDAKSNVWLWLLQIGKKTQLVFWLAQWSGTPRTCINGVCCLCTPFPFYSKGSVLSWGTVRVSLLLD